MLSEPSKKKTTKGRAQAARQEGGTTLGGPPPQAGGTTLGGPPPQMGGTALADHTFLSLAVEGFVRDNSNFESSYALDAAMHDANVTSDLQALFAVPLQHKLFTMDSALRWVLFLHVAPGRAVQEGDAPFSAFSSEAALDLIAQIYDIGLQEAAWDHFEDDEDDEADEADAADEADVADEGA